MKQDYPFNEIETRWQDFWDDNGDFQTDLTAAENPYRLLLHKAGRPVVVVAFRGLASQRLKGLADTFAWTSITRPGHWLRILPFMAPT